MPVPPARPIEAGNRRPRVSRTLSRISHRGLPMVGRVVRGCAAHVSSLPPVGPPAQPIRRRSRRSRRPARGSLRSRGLLRSRLPPVAARPFRGLPLIDLALHARVSEARRSRLAPPARPHGGASVGRAARLACRRSLRSLLPLAQSAAARYRSPPPGSRSRKSSIFERQRPRAGEGFQPLRSRSRYCGEIRPLHKAGKSKVDNQ